VLAVERINAGYGAAMVLSEVDLTVGEGESVAIIGANGAGKSTLVRAICGLLPVVGGRILKDGVEIHNAPAHRRPELGIAVALEGRHLFGELSVQANLQLAAKQGAKRKTPRFEFAMKDVLTLFPFMKDRESARVELLSGGEQQMVAIARALLLKPELLILDEPSIGLAPKVVGEIIGVLATLRKQGMSLLLVEQNVAVATQSADRAYVLSLGKVVDRIGHERWTSAATSQTLAKAYLGGK